MTKSFLYSLVIHLLLGTLFITALMQPNPKHEEQKISINLTSPYPPKQPSIVPSQTITAAPSKPITAPVPPKPTVTTVPKPPVTVQNTPSATSAVEIPSPKPVVPTPITVAQPAPLPSVKTPPPPPPSVNVEKEYLKLNLGEIRALLIQNQQYPKQAKRLRMQGDVEVHFQLNANGSIEDLKIAQSSGFDILDDDAKALILKTAPQFPKPSKSVQLRIPISYVLH